MSYITNNLEQYEKEADQWWQPNGIFSSLKGFNEPRFRYFDRHIPSFAGITVLDVGCGGGYTSEFMAKRGANVSGVDLSAKSIEAAKSHARLQGLNIDYQAGRAEQLDYEDNSFEVVICVDVLEHVSDLPLVIAEIYRVLKPGGYFLFDTINRTFLSKLLIIFLLENILREVPKGTHDWDMFIKPAELSSLMEKSGFQGIDLKGFDISGKQKNTNSPKVKINNNTSVMYIGKARK